MATRPLGAIWIGVMMTTTTTPHFAPMTTTTQVQTLASFLLVRVYGCNEGVGANEFLWEENSREGGWQVSLCDGYT